MNGQPIELSLEIAVIIPCYNEAAAIEEVVSDFKHALPQAKIYVYDNMSADDTACIAEKAGAAVRYVRERGKGSVVRKMFADVDADVYVMADGDATYTAADAPKMVQKILDGADMVVAVRKAKNKDAYPMFHVFGNRMFSLIMKILFNSGFHDVFSGYRAFSRRFVKAFPATAKGFGTEAELSVYALTHNAVCAEITSVYRARKNGSFSKLNTIKDGFCILISVLLLFVKSKPRSFFGIMFLLFALVFCGLHF